MVVLSGDLQHAQTTNTGNPLFIPLLSCDKEMCLSKYLGIGSVVPLVEIMKKGIKDRGKGKC